MLTDAECRNAKCPPDKKRMRLTDAEGLYLEVSPAGSKRWFWKTYRDGKEGRLALGSYPAVTLPAARKARNAAKAHKSEGRDPVQVRKIEKLKATRTEGDTFKAVALEWYAKQATQWSEAHADRSLRQFERDLFQWIGERRMLEIHSMELLAALHKIEERGALETAYRGKSFAAITDPIRMGDLMRAIMAYKGGPVVRAALQLAPLLYQRPGNLRMMEWAELDLDAALWTIPSQKMKRTKLEKEQGDDHVVPLPTQTVALLRSIQPLTGRGQYVFPGERSHDRLISDNSVRSYNRTIYLKQCLGLSPWAKLCKH